MRLSKKNSAVLALGVVALLLSGCSAPATEPKPETTTAVSEDTATVEEASSDASFTGLLHE